MEDIDAALSSAAMDYHGSAVEFVARLDPAFFRETRQPDLSGGGLTSWEPVAQRLRRTSLILVPALPTPATISERPELLDVVGMPIVRLGGIGSNWARWAVLSQEEVADIRSAELTDIFNKYRERCILRLGRGHFELPSGAHTTHFMRFAECLADIETVDRFVYWIAREHRVELTDLPMDTCTAVLVDHQSLLILGLRLAQVLPQARMHSRCIPAYPETVDASREMEAWIELNVPSNCVRLLSIISVSSTGSLGRLIASACSKLNLQNAFSVLYATTTAADKSAYCALQISGYLHFSDEFCCDICADESASPVFQIDRARYFLHERKIRTVALPVSLFKKQREFIEKFGGVPRVLLTHIKDPNDANPRHHAFYVSVSELLRVTAFREELVRALSKIRPSFDLVVIPDHAVGRELGNLVAGHFGCKVAYHNDLRLDANRAEDATLIQTLSISTSLLVLDDLAFSGRRIQSYNKALREGAVHAPKKVTFFPVVILCEWEETWARVVRGIESQHEDNLQKVDWLYLLELPDWDEERCPWCIERRELERLPALNAGEEDDRRSAILQRQTGLVTTDWLALPLGGAAPSLGRNSPILPGGSAPIQVLFSCASALQQARHRPEEHLRLDPLGFPETKLLDVSVFKDYQNELLLNVCMLRSVRSSELSEPLRRHLLDVLDSIDSGRREHDSWALREFQLAQSRAAIKRERAVTNGMPVGRRRGFLGFLQSLFE